MNSEELNKAIADICDDASIAFEIAGTGKRLPYIGWFWRRVNFDQETYNFGVIPHGTPSHTITCGDTVEERGPYSTAPLVGFMENNKWDYPYVHADACEWAEIKGLLEAAVISRSVDDLSAVNVAIQKLGSKPHLDLDC